MQKLLKKKPKSTYAYDLYRDGITQSALANFLTCPQKFNLSQNQGWASERNGFAIDFGDIVHGALDKVYSRFNEVSNAGEAIKVLNSVLPEMRDKASKGTRIFNILNSSIEEEIDKNYSLVKVLLSAYFHQWFKEDKKRDWLFLEKKFDNIYKGTKLLGTPYEDWVDIPMKGKIDGVYKVKNSYYQLETKTKGQINESEMKDKLTFDLQNFFYLYNSAILLGKRPAGVLYNVMRRPQLRQGVKEQFPDFLKRVEADIADRSDFYFMRWHVTVSDEEFENWVQEFHKIMQNLVRCIEGREYFRNSLGCSAFKTTCRFMPVCSRGDFSGLKIRENAFPELAD